MCELHTIDDFDFSGFEVKQAASQP
jgi:hypothetical protein